MIDWGTWVLLPASEALGLVMCHTYAGDGQLGYGCAPPCVGDGARGGLGGHLHCFRVGV